MKFKSSTFLIFLLAVSFVFFAVLSFLSEGSWGGADNVVHYRIAHYAFKYPHLFLDLWGKPLFTILSSPLAQLGYHYMRLFNVIVAILTAFLSVKILDILKLKDTYLAIPSILFSPIYFVLVPTAMTELLFGLIIILAIYFFFKENFVLSSVAISFLPFARNEGFILIPIFFLAFLLKKKYRVLPFLVTGFVFFSLLGWKHFGSFFWILENNPYTGAASLYGSGSLLHFVDRSPQVFGIPLVVLFIVGLFFATRNFIKDRLCLRYTFFFYLLVVGSALTYFAAHSYVWWKGMGGSLGLTRVMAGIVPLFALTAVYGINQIPVKADIRRIISIIAIVVIVYIPFQKYQIPFQIDATEKLVKETSSWLLDHEWISDRLIFYYDPVFCHYLKLDPFDQERTREQIHNREKPEESVPVGAIVIWDGHFGPNEGGMPLQKLRHSPAFKQIYHVEPKHEITVLNGHKYEIFVFERI
jgi:ABC-type cobalt transport system substrate-binding protein